ncbi:hypothetical protein NFI96_032426, partial [Prochilodus magdalenae]
MQQYTPGVLIFLLSVFSTGSGSALPTVRVELQESATLPCYERCSGVVTWIESRNPTEVLAECNQTSCRSVKEGYQMIHDQYLKGDLSLTITAADLSTRGLYTCTCNIDDTELCDVVLQVEPLNTAAQVKPGEALVLKLDVSVPVEVIYNRTGAAGPSSVQICTVDGGSLQCKPDYTQRSSLISGLELRGLTVSEGGVYTVRDIRTKEVVHTCTVTVQARSENTGTEREQQVEECQIMSYNYLNPPIHPLDPIPPTLLQSVPMNLLPFITLTMSSSLPPGFDTVNHEILLSVLTSRGTTYTTWFESMEERRYEGTMERVYVCSMQALHCSSSGPGPGPAQVQVQLRSRSTMQQYTPGVLIFLLSVFSTGSESADPTVRVELHDSATLPCSERCSGVVRWTESSNPTEVLAECNQTSCRSVKEGYQMIHDQYLKGDLSLTITAAGLSTRGLYTCYCDGDSELCDVELQVEPLNTAVQVKPGEALVLKLDLSVPVEVIYNRTGAAGPSSVQICTVDGGSLQCRPDYTQRSSLISGLELRGLTVSEGGVYTVRDIRTKEVVHTCTVTV